MMALQGAPNVRTHHCGLRPEGSMLPGLPRILRGMATQIPMIIPMKECIR